MRGWLSVVWLLDGGKCDQDMGVLLADVVCWRGRGKGMM